MGHNRVVSSFQGLGGRGAITAVDGSAAEEDSTDEGELGGDESDDGERDTGGLGLLILGLHTKSWHGSGAGRGSLGGEDGALGDGAGGEGGGAERHGRGGEGRCRGHEAGEGSKSGRGDHCENH